jgi:hypothetical protein
VETIRKDPRHTNIQFLHRRSSSSARPYNRAGLKGGVKRRAWPGVRGDGRVIWRGAMAGRVLSRLSRRILEFPDQREGIRLFACR